MYSMLRLFIWHLGFFLLVCLFVGQHSHTRTTATLYIRWSTGNSINFWAATVHFDLIKTHSQSTKWHTFNFGQPNKPFDSISFLFFLLLLLYFTHVYLLIRVEKNELKIAANFIHLLWSTGIDVCETNNTKSAWPPRQPRCYLMMNRDDCMRAYANIHTVFLLCF